MIQRKQTLFLLLALIAIVVCLTMPVGRFIASGEGADYVLFNNMLMATAPASASPSPYFAAPLAIFLLIACPLTLWTIFKYKSLKLQAFLCKCLIALMILWYAWYAFLGYWLGIEGTAFRPAFAAALPLVAVVLFVMARKGIKSDIKLLKSVDRIR